MSIAALSSSAVNQQASAYFQKRRADMQQLGKDLKSGDLAAAQQDFNSIQTLAQGGPLSGGNAFKVSARQQDFTTLGQDLQSGDLAGAQQAYAQLQATFNHRSHVATPTAADSSTPTSSGSPTAAASPTATGGSEIVLNLGNVTPGEQITIGLSGTASGGEQVSVSVAQQQNQTPEQFTFNLNPSSNQQIILNLFNCTADASTQSNGTSVTA